MPRRKKIITSQKYKKNATIEAPCEIHDQREHGFWITHDDVINLGYARAIKPTGFAVYSSILKHSNKKTGESWPSYATIANDVGISRRQAIREIEKLSKFGLILVKPATDYGTNHFFILDKKQWHFSIDYQPPKKRIVTKASKKGSDCESPVTMNHHSDHVSVKKSLETRVPIREPRKGSDSQSPVTHSHRGGDSQSPKQELMNKNHKDLSLPTLSHEKVNAKQKNKKGARAGVASQQEKEKTIYQQCADMLGVKLLKIKKIHQKYQPTLERLVDGCQQAISDQTLKSPMWWLMNDDAWCNGEYVPYECEQLGNNGNGKGSLNVLPEHISEQIRQCHQKYLASPHIGQINFTVRQRVGEALWQNPNRWSHPKFQAAMREVIEQYT